MSYQLCPKCKGSGERNLYTGHPWLDVALMAALMPYKDKDGNIKLYKQDTKCPVCRGKMIISTITGLPPEDGLKKDEEK